MGRLKNYKSRCICIITVTFNHVGRKILKLSCTVLSLVATIQSSDVVTNRITDVYHASAMEKNIVSKRAEVNNTKECLKDTKKDIKKEDVKISTEKVENNKNKKSCKIDSKTISTVKKLIKNNSKKLTQQKAQRIASVTAQKSKKTNACCIPEGYEYLETITGDATYYGPTGNPMRNGKFPVAGRDCAMHPKYLGCIVEIIFTNGEKIIREVGDTGDALINGGAVVDIFCNTVSECRRNGRKHNVKVKIWSKKRNKLISKLKN